MEFDHGIKSAVSLLQAGGFKTFTSCQGGSGHPFSLPTVGILATHSEANAIKDYLLGCGLKDFVVVKEKCYQERWVEVEEINPFSETKGQYIWVQGVDLIMESPV